MSNPIFDIFSHDTDDLSIEKLNLSSVANQISGRYEISGSKIFEMGNEYVDAYNVVDLIDANNSSNLYAIAYKKNMPFRLSEIIKSKTYNSPNFISPIDYGITQLGSSEEQYFVVILNKPKGESLKNMVLKGFRMDANYAFNKFLPQALQAINTLHQSEIIHGFINPDNIFIDETGNVVLSECITELCGYSQPAFYETVDRAQCLPLGKSTGSTCIDFYALGMTLFYAVSGRDFTGSDVQEIIRQKLFQGTFHFLNAAHLLSGQIGDLIKGLVADQDGLRWGATEVDGILQGRNYSTSDLTDLTFLSRAVIFNGREHYSKRSLAYDLSVNWDLAREFIKTDKIKKWLETVTAEEKIVEAIELFGNSTSSKSLSQKLISLEDERLIKLLIILDPEGPVRFKNMVFYKESIGPILAHSMAFSHTESTQLLAAFIFLNIFSIYEVLANLFSNSKLTYGMTQINRASDFLKKSEYGFGIERCLYDLNPSLVCQSPVVSSIFCIGLNDILDFLNTAELNFEDLVAKKTISCFLASKIVLMTEVKNKELDKFPLVQRSRAYQILGIFAQAQKHAKITNLSNLCSTIMQSVRDVLDASLKSTSIKKVFFDKLAIASKTGNIMELQKIALNSRHINDDIDGYTDALRKGALIAREMFSFNNRSAINFDVRRKSLRIAVRFSYIICSFIILSIIMQSI
jgi:serine/threonine protein kinase